MSSKFVTYILSLLSLLLVIAVGCDKEDYNMTEDSEEVAASFTVSLGDTRSRANDINLGGDANVDWNQYDLRYIFEIWRRDIEVNYPQKRYVKTFDNFTQSTTFDVILSATNFYDYLFWVDIVKQGESSDLHYNTDFRKVDGQTGATQKFGLKYVHIRVDEDESGHKYTGNDDTNDAWTYFIENKKMVDASNEPIQLKRPFAKLITKASKVMASASTVNIKYENIPYAYNVLNGVILPGAIGDLSFTGIPWDNYASNGQTLSWDYIFVSNGTPSTISYSITVPNLPGQEHSGGQGYRVADAPIEANKLTNVNISLKKIYKVGDVYTSENGQVKGVVYHFSSNDGINQIFDIVALDQPNGRVDWTAAKQFCTDKGGSWSMPTRQDLLNLYIGISGVGAIVKFNNAMDPDIQVWGDGNAYYDSEKTITYPAWGYWSSDKDGADKAYVIWMGPPPTGEEKHTNFSFLLTDNAFATAVYKNISN